MRFSLFRAQLGYGDRLQVFTASSGPVPALEELYLRVDWPGGVAWAEARANIAYASGVPAEAVPGLAHDAARAAAVAGCTDPDALLAHLDATRAPHPIARNLLECAALEGLARSQGVAVAALLGGGEGGVRPVESNQCIFAGDTLERAASRAAAYAAEGFRRIKVRVGVGTAAEDTDRLRAIRAAVGDDVHLAVDANGTWSVAETVERLRALDGLGVEYCEQPTPPGDWTAFAEAASRTGWALMADEGLRTEADHDALRRIGPPHLAHLKLPKSGGPRPLVRQARALAEAGIRCMVGQMNEGALATAAALHCALAARPALAELYGAYGLLNDPAQGLRYRDGAAAVEEPVGVGVRLDPGRLTPVWSVGEA